MSSLTAPAVFPANEHAIDFPASRGGCPFAPSPDTVRLQREQPIARVRIWSDTTPWLVTRWEDAREVLSDRRFSADTRTPGYPFVTPAFKALAETGRTLIRQDPPDHSRLRRIVAKELLVKHVDAWRPRIQRIVDDLVDNLIAQGPPADLVTDYASAVPSIVISTMLGVPYEEHEFFQRTSTILMDHKSTLDQAGRAAGEILDFINRLASAKADRPADDILSRLVEQERQGNLTRQEVAGLAGLLLVGGHETSTHAIALSITLLLRHPGELAKLRADPSLYRTAVDELLRYTSIIHTGLMRVALEDVEIGGQLIRAGEGVLVLAPTANRQPEVFPDPDVLDVTRDARRHVAFGYGMHQCLGQSLARAELQTALETLFRRLPDLRFAVPFEEIAFRETKRVYGVYELPVTWSAHQ